MEKNFTALQKVLELLKNDNLFLTGGGGVGKSYLCNEIINKYKENKKQIVVLGSTGISAVHVGGQTIHSFFRFGISSNTEELKRYDKKQSKKLKQLYTILSKCELLIIDEISMVSSWLLDMIRFRLLYGGFNGRILFVGDFFQLPPVKKVEQNQLFHESIYAFSSSSWNYFNPKIALLSKAKRTQNKKFFEVLSKIRVGNIDEETIGYLEKLTFHEDIISQDPTWLFGRNKEAKDLNKKKLYELENELFSFAAEVEIFDKNLHEGKLSSWKNALNVDEVLEVKIGSSVLFCTNKIGSYFNGQRGIVVDICDDSIKVKKRDNSVVIVERHEYNLNDILVIDGEVQEVTLASFKQFPLKLAYAITIHKSQGMSIEKLVCNIDNIFEKSQLYVALSRAIDPKMLYIYYKKHNFKEHIMQCVKVDNDVLNFYENSDIIYLEKD